MIMFFRIIILATGKGKIFNSTHSDIKEIGSNTEYYDVLRKLRFLYRRQ